MSETNPQPRSVTAPVLMPALVEGAFDYLVPEGTPEGALVEATLASRSLVGVVWKEGVARVESRESSKEVASRQSPVASEDAARAVVPLPLRERLGEGALKQSALLSNPLTQPSPARGEGSPAAPPLPAPSTEHPAPKNKKPYKLKPVTRVIEGIPPLKSEFRAWIDWVSHFTLAPKGAVLSLCGLAHGAKTTRKKFVGPGFTIALPTLTEGQQAVVEKLAQHMLRVSPSPTRGEDGRGACDAHDYPLAQTLAHARALRQTMTDAETKLWQKLRRENLGVKFRKQHPLGPYIVDFVCLELKLIIELDGGQHAEQAAQNKDKIRTAFFESQGFTVIRFWNDELLRQEAGVLEAIHEVVKCLMRPHPNPPPIGEGIPPRRPLRPILLDGVTGSGKTEVYFHLIAEAMKPYTEADEGAVRSAPREPLAAGGSDSVGDKVPLNQVLVLLPEIALTHQWLERFEKTFGAAPVVWHSRMTPAAKARAWQAVARGEAPIVVGARSALFLPFANLQLIIVDEEHDPSYKQEEGVLYHARDMAVARAHFERIPILLVSATPSLETMENVREGKYHAVQLPERFGAAGLPTVKLVDMRTDTPERGNFIAPSVKAAMLETLARGEQVLFFMNRRGYAPLLLCRACGHRFECPDCSAWLVVHGQAVASRQSPVASDSGLRSVSEPEGRGFGGDAPIRREALKKPPSKPQLHCHHCNHREPLPNTCPACNATADKLAACGPGVERIAQEVRDMFVGMHSASAVVPPPLGGRLGGGRYEAPIVPFSAPPQPSPYGGGSECAAKTLPVPNTLNFARQLRKNLTEAEKKLWRLLRHEQMGARFRKQHPIGNYIADFACLDPKLIIELDGGQHNDLEAIAYDKARTAFFEAQRFHVLRFWNHDVLDNGEGVFEKILASINSLTRPHPNPPPLGEGSPRLVTLSSDEAIAAETWADIEAGKVDILVGTQMVAKGHHFPRLTLVVVVDADVGLDGADLRAGERSYQLLHQLGGRAGRGELQGQVLVQTYCPEHAVMKALVAHDRNRLMALEAKERKIGGWPPFGQLAAILLDGVDEAKVRAAGQMLARTAPHDPRIRVLGPAQAPLSKLRGQYRYRLLIKADKTIGLQATLRQWLMGQKFSGVRIKVDVNPYYFL